MNGKNIILTGGCRSKKGGAMATALLLLSCAILQSACANDTMRGDLRTEIPESLLQGGEPGVVEDLASATQADLAAAYEETYVAWEGCAANLGQLEAILKGTGGL